VSVFAAVALTAAVVEEAAFRGYMLSGIQRRFGWAVGIQTSWCVTNAERRGSVVGRQTLFEAELYER
jgi:hypothetical protein